MKKFRKRSALTLAMVLATAMALAAAILTGCGRGDHGGRDDDGRDGGQAIHVIAREDGSGTRGAFAELFGIEQKDADGNRVDRTVETAEITNSTAVMLQTVAGDQSAIGYVSLGSLDDSDDSVKALKVDGAAATAANVKSGDYKAFRPFSIVTRGGRSDAAKDFIDYILSDEGQAVVSEAGYVSVESRGSFKGGKARGRVRISGSSSVAPVMEKLAEAYETVNKDVVVSVQQSDSTTGVADAAEGVSDIGMVSRALSGEETAAGLRQQTIALDGIAVIVNPDNDLTEITSNTVLKIYTGEIRTWEDVK